MRRSIPLFLLLIAVAPALVAEQPTSTRQIDARAIVPHHDQGHITWGINVPAQMVTLRVVGSNGEVFTKQFVAPERPAYYFTSETGSHLPDGQYHYEVIAHRALSTSESAALAGARTEAQTAWEEAVRVRRSLDPGEEGGTPVSIDEVQRLEGIAAEAAHNVEQLQDQLQRQNGPFAFTSGGSFEIELGAVIVVEESMGHPDPSDLAGGRSYEVNAVSGEPAVGTMDFSDPDDIKAGSGLMAGSTLGNPNDGELELVDAVPFISYVDTSTGEDIWYTLHDSHGFVFQEGAEHIFTLSDGAPHHSLFIDSSGRVGLNTTSPAEPLEIAGVRPEFRLTATSDATHTTLEYNNGLFGIEGNSSQPIIQMNATAPAFSLVVDSLGRAGFGTSTPEVDIHIADSVPALRLEDVNASGATWDLRNYQPSSTKAEFQIMNVDSGAVPFRIDSLAPHNSFNVSDTGDVGIGTSTPNGRFHIVGTDSPRVRMEDTLDNANDKPGLAMKSPASNGGGEWRFETDNAGNFQIDYSLSAGPEIVIIDDPANNGQVKINGNLVVQGTCTGCDAVFQPGYPLESIEEHASLMWDKSYLPAVGPTPEGETSLNVFEKTVGILQELEKAHIYIAQLHEEKSQLKMVQNEMLDEQNRMADELETLRKLEAENDELRKQLLQISLRLTFLESSASTHHTRRVE